MQTGNQASGSSSSSSSAMPYGSDVAAQSSHQAPVKDASQVSRQSFPSTSYTSSAVASAVPATGSMQQTNRPHSTIFAPDVLDPPTKNSAMTRMADARMSYSTVKRRPRVFFCFRTQRGYIIASCIANYIDAVSLFLAFSSASWYWPPLSSASSFQGFHLLPSDLLQQTCRRPFLSW